jgi:shikimate kinase
MRRCGAKFTLLTLATLRQNDAMPSAALHRNIVLIGFMGSGKSSIGRLLAKHLGWRFADTDRLIVDRSGMEIPGIFATHGEAGFRDLETAALESLGSVTRTVLATGGGAVLRECNRALLRELGFVVALTATEEVIFERVSRNKRRPLLQTDNPRETVAGLLAERRPLYAEAAQFSLDTSSLSHAEAAELILAEARRNFLWQGAA